MSLMPCLGFFRRPRFESRNSVSIYRLVFRIGYLFLLAQIAIPIGVIASPGTSGAAFLDIPVGAQPASLGGAYSALATDAYAPIWNPAGLGFLPLPQVSAQHLSYLQSINYEFAGFAIPIRPLSAHSGGLGGAILYLGAGDFGRTDASGDSIGTYTSHYGAYTLAYGQRAASGLSVGAGIKMVEAKLADVSAHAFAVDLGMIYQATEKLRLAATCVNAGTNLKFSDTGDHLPLALHASGAYDFNSRFLLTLEGVYDRSGAGSARFGIEWSPLSMIALRTGYRTDTLRGLSPIAGFSAGLGLKVFGQEFSYAWLPYGDLGDTQYFSMLLKFGAKDEEHRHLIRYESIKRLRSVKQKDSTAPVIDSDNDQLIHLLNEGRDRTAESGKVEKQP